MKEYPIIFSDEMVRAIIEDRKTQTRRINKLDKINIDPVHWKPQGENIFGQWIFDPQDDLGNEKSLLIKCPYGVPSDRLWVRETWRFRGTDMNKFGRTHLKQEGSFVYKADGKQVIIERPFQDIEKLMKRDDKWKPSIQMPRWASRTTLEVTNVKVERVQDISEEDAKAEGVGCVYSMEFAKLWDSINEKRGFGWDKNPWVWVVEFKVIKGK